VLFPTASIVAISAPAFIIVTLFMMPVGMWPTVAFAFLAVVLLSVDAIVGDVALMRRPVRPIVIAVVIAEIATEVNTRARMVVVAVSMIAYKGLIAVVAAMTPGCTERHCEQQQQQFYTVGHHGSPGLQVDQAGQCSVDVLLQPVEKHRVGRLNAT